MKNNLLDTWLADAGYFDALAILSDGTLHPGKCRPNTILASRLDWAGCEVLEIGGGTGLSHRFFNSLGATVTAVEPNRWMRFASLRNGTPRDQVLPLTAEALTREWLTEHCTKARLLVQGTTGFLDDGLRSLSPILHHAAIREVVFVEWFGQADVFGAAPITVPHPLSDYVAAVEMAGFRRLWLETDRYTSTGADVPEATAIAQVEFYFPEAKEIIWRDRISQKLSMLHREQDREKDYFVLWAAK